VIGLVIKSTGSWYKILCENELYDGRLRGIFRSHDLKSTNPIAVGDWVEFEIEEGKTVNINEIHPRKNSITRRSTRSSAQSHIIAANLDQAVLVITLKDPRTSLGFIDRFLVLTESFRIPTVLLFNKIDTYSAKQKAILAEYKSIYEAIGYPCFEISLKDKTGVDVLKPLFEQKVTLIAGHSGVGKSTLLNYLNPDFHLKTNTISKFSGKGTHTTTFVEMYPMGEDTYVIDSPGIKELGIVDMEPEEISHYFVEMRDYLNKCKFHNCTHIHEPNCSVKEAADKEIIHPMRYYNYLSIMQGDDFKEN